MPSTEFRKLHIDLPTENPVDSRPWQVAGILFALIILLLIAYMYFNQNEGTRQTVKKIEVVANQN